MKLFALLMPVAALLVVSPASGLTGNGRAGGPENYFDLNHGMANGGSWRTAECEQRARYF